MMDSPGPVLVIQTTKGVGADRHRQAEQRDNQGRLRLAKANLRFAMMMVKSCARRRVEQ